MASSTHLPEASTTLRQELKEWEQAFTAKNNGRKAERADIKKDPTIAAKYKEYNRLRGLSSGKPPRSPSQAHRPKKRKNKLNSQDEATHQTPKKRHKHTAITPSRTPSNHPSVIDPYDAPFAVRALNLTPLRTSIGPTPQKDGTVLGLFDLLSDTEDPLPAGTPSKLHHLNTPRKSQSASTPSHRANQRTPASSGKRFMLNSFLTPSGGRGRGRPSATTPSSAPKLEFDTPAFLRRGGPKRQTYAGDGLGPVGEEGEDILSPIRIRMPPRPPARGLSSMLASLRKMEDEAQDDDLEALREIENEAIGEANRWEAAEKEEAGEGVPEGGGKVYKKKGQKRTTKRVHMRPVPRPVKRPSALKAKLDLDAARSSRPDGEAEGGEEAIESHHNPTDRMHLPSAGNPPSPSPERNDDEEAEEDGEEEHDPVLLAKDAALVAAEMAKLSGTTGTKSGVVERVKRKIKESAHANFRRLKIRGSHGAKGSAKGGGKFRGRRR